MGWLEGKVALVTGGASGLGLGIVQRFLAEGAEVGVLDASAAKLSDLSELTGGRVAAVRGDVRSLDDNRRAAEQLVARHGRLDVFIGNAGIWDYSTSLVDLPEQELSAAFDEVVGVNVKGYLLGARAVVPHLVRSRGTIIFTVSNAGFYVGGGGPLYTLSKHAVVGLVRQLAHELAPVVRVNGVAPGAVPSDLRGPQSLGMADKSIRAFDMQSVAEQIMPLPRVPTPADQAGTYVYLASAANSGAATGIVINSDCGIGVRGLWAVRGGADLVERFGSLPGA
jgi:NAD(P)-dependent dehydrogenase (short-subunit alcohol dehydrogenase family)